MGTAATYYHSSLLARGTLTCGTQHVLLTQLESRDYCSIYLTVEELAQECVMNTPSLLLLSGFSVFRSNCLLLGTLVYLSFFPEARKLDLKNNSKLLQILLTHNLTKTLITLNFLKS